MGGSILGTETIYSFLKFKIKKKVYFFDDLNLETIANFKKKEKINKTLFLVISKSGETIETISNFTTLNILKKNAKNIIIISEKRNNTLYDISKKFNIFYVEHKKHIGGRYSVLSEIGMLPAYLLGLNINKLRSNIQNYLRINKKFFLRDSTIKIANLLVSKKISNLIFLNYSPEISSFLFWCQQLISESLGKNSKGFLPLVSTLPKDNHSLLQLYLDGPKNNIFYIFSIDKKEKKKIKSKNIFKKFIVGKSLDDIKNAQKKALIKTLNEKNIPYREFKIRSKSENTLGELFSYFIIETIIVGKLININPFNQPAVEKVKVYTKEFLN